MHRALKITANCRSSVKFGMMARGATSDAGSAFDETVAFAPGHLPVQGPADVAQPTGFVTALDVAEEAGVPTEVANGVLGRLGS